MIHEPTRIDLLPKPPVVDRRRPLLMAGLALAEHVTAMAVLPTWIKVECPAGATEAMVVAYCDHDLAPLHDWQFRFGGDMHHQLTETSCRTQVISTLTGVAFDAPFRIWTVRDVQHTPTACCAELALAEWWVAEHGAPPEWTEPVRKQYVTALVELRAELAL
ncbi:hypothetical protein [Kitasatospora sp. P5_F3]